MRLKAVVEVLAFIVLVVCSAAQVHAASVLSISVSTTNAVVTATSTNSTLATVTVTANWDMPGYKNVNVATCTYMTAGLTAPGASTVPISNVRVIQGTTTRTMVNQPSCSNAGALVLGKTFITDNNAADPLTRSRNGSLPSTMQLQVVNTGSLLPGTYTGTVVVTALVY